jgi:hypothetical protein
MQPKRYFDWQPLMLSDNLGAANEVQGDQRRKTQRVRFVAGLFVGD